MERFTCGSSKCITCQDSPANRMGDTIRHATTRYTTHRKRIANAIIGNIEAKAELLNIDSVIREIERAVECFMIDDRRGGTKDV